MASATISSTTTASEANPPRSFTSMVLQPKPTWPNPVDSLGDELRPMRHPLKQRRQWSAIGPAAEAFLEVCHKFQTLKEDRDDLVQLEDKAWPWGWSFCMAGRAPEDAKPYIIVHCESKSCSLKIVQIIQRETWWEEFHDKYPSIGFAVDKTAPRPLCVTKFWRCCHCRHGPYDVSIHDRCVRSCGQARCGNCRLIDVNPSLETDESALGSTSTTKSYSESRSSAQSGQKGLKSSSLGASGKAVPENTSDLENLRHTFAFEGRQLVMSEMGSSYPSFSCKATIGGVLIVGPRMFGFTTAHAFSTSLKDSNAGYKRKDTREEDYDEVDFLSDSDEDEVEEGLVAATSKGENGMFRRDGVDFLTAHLGSESSDEMFDSQIPGTPGDKSLNSGSGAGEMLNSAEKDDQRAYQTPVVGAALSDAEVHISNLSAVEVDFKKMFDMSLLGKALDWALIPLETLIKSTGGSYPLSKACEATNQSLRPKLSASKVAQTPFHPKDIFTITASSGKIKGRIDTTPFIMRPEASTKFFHTYRVRLERTISYGDSGSWVFDDDGHLYGHIIAAEPGRLTGFLVPAVELFRDIEGLLDGKVQLMSDYLPWLLEREASTGHLPNLQIGDSLLKSTALTEETAKELAAHVTSPTGEISTLGGKEDPTKTSLTKTSASAIQISPGEVHGRPEPQQLTNHPRTVSNYGQSFSKGHIYWICHICGDGPSLFNIHVVCTHCEHRRCDYCYTAYSN